MIKDNGRVVPVAHYDTNIKKINENIFHVLRIKKNNMIASYEQYLSGVDGSQHWIDELEKLHCLWSLVEQNASLTSDEFKFNLINSKNLNWVFNRQKIESLSCDQNLRFPPYLKMGDGLYLVWNMLNFLKQSSNFNNQHHHIYSHLNPNGTLGLSPEGGGGRQLQSQLYFEVLFWLKQYLGTTNYQPNHVIPTLTHRVTNEQVFDTLLERYQSIFCLTLNIQLPLTLSEMVEYNVLIQDRLMRIPELQLIMQRIPGLLFMMTKVEHDLVSGLNLNVVLMLNNQKEQLSARIIKKIESEFKKILIDRPFHIHPWGEQLAQGLKKEAIDGVINSTNHRKIKDFKYWILNIFKHVDAVIQFLYILNYQIYPINHIWYSSELSDGRNFPLDLAMMARKSFQDMVRYEDDKIWSVRHQPVLARNRLKISQIFNRELANELGDFTNFIGLIQNIEIFMTTVMNTTVGAFDLPIRLGNVELTAEEIEHSITRIGHQLLWICSHLSDLLLLSTSLYLSRLNISVQFFLKKMNLWQIDQQLAEKTSKQGAERFNALVKQLRSNYHSNIRQSKLDVKIWKQVQNSVTVDMDESTTDNHQTTTEVIEYVDYVQTEGVSDEIITTNDHIEACYKKCGLRSTSLVTYLKSLLKKECILYRVRFGLESNGAEVNQQIFSKNITEMFLRNRSREPVSSMTGYFGAWREYNGQHTYLDLILVFDARKYEELKSKGVLLGEMWKTQMNTVQQDRFKTLFDTVPLMRSVPELNQQSLLLEIGDQFRRKQVFEVLVNYYSYLELYERQATIRVPKVLVKGSVVKTKPKIKTKSKA